MEPETVRRVIYVGFDRLVSPTRRPKSGQKASEWQSSSENRPQIRPEPKIVENISYFRSPGSLRNPATGVGEGSRRGQGRVRGGSSRVKADDHAPRARPYQEKRLNNKNERLMEDLNTP